MNTFNVQVRATVAVSSNEVHRFTHERSRQSEAKTPSWEGCSASNRLQECKSSARAEARARTNVSWSVEPQPYRVGAFVTAREASIAFPRRLRLESGMQMFGSSTATPNPSIEGMPKRLRLSVTPHVKR